MPWHLVLGRATRTGLGGNNAMFRWPRQCLVHCNLLGEERLVDAMLKCCRPVVAAQWDETDGRTKTDEAVA